MRWLGVGDGCAEWWCVTFTDCREGHAGESVRLKRERYGTVEVALDRGVEKFTAGVI